MITNLFHLFFPKLCNGCHSVLLKNEGCICTKCRFELPFTYHHLLEKNELTEKFYGILPIEFACSMLYFYNKGIVREMIHNLKYRNQQEIGSLLGAMYGNELKQNKICNSIDFIIPTPIHKKRKAERGYNQITTFCEALSKELNIPVAYNLIIRKNNSQTQTLKNKQKRASINKEDFALEHCIDFENKHLLLVDDVITTGATIEAIGKKLLEIKNSKLSIVSIAFTK